MAALPLRWERGGLGWLLSLEGEAAVLRSSVPFPPGSRSRALLDGGATFTLKAHRSVREEDGVFRLEGRLVDLTRALREELTAKLAEAPR